jgi:glycosyltransferase involved in cell wall biosynthesis
VRNSKEDIINRRDKCNVVLFISLINLLDIHLEKDVVRIPLTFKKLGFKVYYVLNSVLTERKDIMYDINIIELKSISFIRLFFTVLVNFRRIKPKIVFMYPLWRYQLFINFILIIYKKILRKRFFIILKLDSDGNLDTIPFNLLLIKIFIFLSIISVDMTIIESEHAKKGLLSYYNAFFKKFLANKIYVMYNGLDTELIMKFRQYLNEYKRENKILVNARVIETKGLYELILALNKIRDEIKDWKIHIVGPIEDKDYYSKLVSTINKLSLSDKISFLGELSYNELIKEYVTAKIFVLPSKKEGFSIARLNAMAACLPIVTTDTGGAEIVKDCCGIIVPVNDVDSLAVAIKKLVKDEELRERYGKSACEKIWNYNLENLVKNLLNYLEKFNY